jgi:hypothetical protein
MFTLTLPAPASLGAGFSTSVLLSTLAGHLIDIHGNINGTPASDAILNLGDAAFIVDDGVTYQTILVPGSMWGVPANCVFIGGTAEASPSEACATVSGQVLTYTGGYLQFATSASGALTIGTTTISGCATAGYVLYNNANVLGCQAASAASLSIGGSITSSTAGYGLYVGTGGSANLLEQFAYGTNVFTALQSTLNGSGAISATTSPVFVTPTLGVAAATSITLGTQGTTQGTLTLANTQSTYAVTVESSNSATAAYTLILPTTAGSVSQCLQNNGSTPGVLVFGSCGSGGSPGGNSTQYQWNSSAAFAGGYLWQGANIIGQQNSTTAQRFELFNTSDTAYGAPTTNFSYGYLDAGAALANTLVIGTTGGGGGATTLAKFEVVINGSNVLDFNATTANYWTIPTNGLFTGSVRSIANNANLALSSGLMDFYFGSNQLQLQAGVGSMISTYQWGWASGAVAATDDTILTRHAAANVQLGAADAAAPVAQTLSAQSVVAGTSNIAGANWSQVGSLSTGSGASGDIIFKTGGTGAAATVQNTAVTAMTIKGATQNVILGSALISAGTAPTATGSGGTCATGAVGPGAIAGSVTLTGVCASTNTITLSGMPAVTTGYSCNVNDRTAVTVGLLHETSTTQTTVVFTWVGTSGATDVIGFECFGN